MCWELFNKIDIFLVSHTCMKNLVSQDLVQLQNTFEYSRLFLLNSCIKVECLVNAGFVPISNRISS